MEQAQRAGRRSCTQACRQIAEAIPRLRTFRDIRHFTVEINRLENDGDRVVREALASLFERGIDPMVVIRWKDIFERLEDAIDATETTGEHPRGHRHQERLASTRMDNDVVLWIVVGTALAFDFTNGFHDTANAVATSISTRAMAPRVAVTMAAIAELRRRVPVAAGRRDDRQRHRRRRPDHADDRLRRPHRRDRLEPADLVLRAAVVVLARADRRRGRRRRSRPTARRRCYGEGLLDKVVIPALVAPVLAFAAAGLGDPRRLPDRRPPAPGTVSRGFRLGQIVSGGLLALVARHQRRAEDDGHHLPGARRQRQPAVRRDRHPDLGRRARRRPRSRSAPTSAAGASSARWAAGSSRWTRRRASRPRARARR